MAVPIEITPKTPESKKEIQQHIEQARTAMLRLFWPVMNCCNRCRIAAF
jgi:hypothetical protein